MKTIVEDLTILSAIAFRLADEPAEMALSEVAFYPNEPLTDPLVKSLTNRLYERYYSKRKAPSERTKRASDILPVLQAANDTVGGWESGWDIVSHDEAGGIVVRKGSRTRMVSPDGWRPDTARAGSADLLRRRDDVTLQADYYYAYGETLGDRYEDLVDVRIYINVAADRAAIWVSTLTQRLNAYRIPFTFKIVRHGAAFDRVDSSVLYVSRRYAGFVASLVIELGELIEGIRAATPLFTRRLALGIAMADNPPGGSSFGLDRMRLVAEGCVTAWRNGDTSMDASVRAIIQRFRFAGIDLHRPWLNAGNVDVAVVPSSRSFTAHPRPCAPQWLDVANRIGLRLVRDAIWYRDQCTWLGWSVIPGSESGKAAICTAGGDLYAGTAGIAIFLAQLARATEHHRYRATAMAALRHAIKRSDLGYWPIGAYSGLAGVLYATMVVSDALDWEEGAAWVPRLLQRLAESPAMDLEVDIVEGRAGAIRALLHVAEWKNGKQILALETATRLGHQIIDLAHRQEGRWSWATKLGGTRHVLGYSHGTTGIALALTELFARTRDPRFIEAAGAALNYELSEFVPEAKNWPDLRHLNERAGNTHGRHFMSAWCSGAPGVALGLARQLCTHRIAGIEQYLDAALETTLSGLLVSLGEEQSFCLCHGIAGNAEILIEAAQLLDRPTLRVAAIGAAEGGVRKYHDSGEWICGVPKGGDSPSLLLGVAGIGYFYLRLHDPSLASPLVL